MTRGQEIFFALFLTPFVALMAWLEADTLREIARWGASATWQAVPATIDASGIRGCGRGGSMPAVRYRYTATRAGQPAELTGERFMFADPPCGERDEAWQAARRYPPGGTVTVYVDPGDATQSVLERSVAGRTWIAFVLLLGTIALLLVFLAGAFLRGRRP